MAAVKEPSEEIRGIGTQPRGRLLVGTGCRRPAKMLDLHYRLKNAADA
jgi:hypothetical protein